jgi:hypothetical protein
MPTDSRLFSPSFPCASKYNPAWVVTHASGGVRKHDGRWNTLNSSAGMVSEIPLVRSAGGLATITTARSVASPEKRSNSAADFSAFCPDSQLRPNSAKTYENPAPGRACRKTAEFPVRTAIIGGLTRFPKNGRLSRYTTDSHRAHSFGCVGLEHERLFGALGANRPGTPFTPWASIWQCVLSGPLHRSARPRERTRPSLRASAAPRRR